MTSKQNVYLYVLEGIVLLISFIKTIFGESRNCSYLFLFLCVVNLIVLGFVISLLYYNSNINKQIFHSGSLNKKIRKLQVMEM